MAIRILAVRKLVEELLRSSRVIVYRISLLRPIPNIVRPSKKLEPQLRHPRSKKSILPAACLYAPHDLSPCGSPVRPPIRQ